MSPEPSLDSALTAVVDAIDGEQRPGQVEMARLVATAIASGTHAVIQAGTGTGKSIGYLVPAALHARSSDGGAVVVATATLALQRQLVERDLPRVADALEPVLGRRPTFAVLKGRGNYVCLERLHGGPADDEGDALFDAPRSALGAQVVQVRAWAESTTTGDRDEYPGEVDPRVWRSVSVSSRECVGEARCAFGGECFTARRRAAAHEADIVVTNHAMLALDAVEGVPILPEHDAVIVDEAHELVDRTTAATSGSLAVAQVERAIGAARRHLEPELVTRLDDAADDLGVALAELGVEGRITALPEALTLALAVLRGACHEAIGAMGSQGDDAETAASRQRARAGLDEVHETAVALLIAGSGDVVWIERSETRAATLRHAPLSVAAVLRDHLFSRTPVVLTSATLLMGGSFSPLLGAVGLADEDVDMVDVGSPFDHGRQGILYVARELPSPGRDGIAMEALDALAELIDAAGGRTLALFSSWRGVERAADYLRVRLDTSRTPLLVQARGDAVGPLVARFADDPASVLLGTVSLWQGVDVPGSSCILVVIDRIPFPRPDDPLSSARQAAVDEAGGSGFRSVAVPRAGLLLAQGAGRLIRGPQDRGVVAVLDSRLATAGYSRALLASLPPFWMTTDRAVVVGALERLAAKAAEADEGTT